MPALGGGTPRGNPRISWHLVPSGLASLFGQAEALLWHQLGIITFYYLIETNLPELVIQVKFEEPRALSQRIHRETAS